MARARNPLNWGPNGEHIRRYPECSVLGCTKEGKVIYGGMCEHHCSEFGPDVPGDVLTWPTRDQARDNMETISRYGFIGLLSPDVRERFDARR